MGICNVAGMCLNRQPTETVIELDDFNSTDKLAQPLSAIFLELVDCM